MESHKTNKFQFIELEKIRFIVKDACGIDIAYAYDDLVFSEHGLFIIRFVDKEGNKLDCWFNNEMIESKEILMFDSLKKTAKLNGSDITYKGRFVMKQEEGSEEIDIEFTNY
jgi:hypothetical protein